MVKNEEEKRKEVLKIAKNDKIHAGSNWIQISLDWIQSQVRLDQIGFDPDPQLKFLFFNFILGRPSQQ